MSALFIWRKSTLGGRIMSIIFFSDAELSKKERNTMKYNMLLASMVCEALLLYLSFFPSKILSIFHK